MKLSVIVSFRDKHNFSRQYSVGEVVEFEETRAQSAIERGLAIPIETEGKAEETLADNTTEETAEPIEEAVDELPLEVEKPKKTRRSRKTE